MELGEGDDAPAAALALTATPLWSAAFADPETLCPEGKATDAAGVAKALGCLRQSVYKDGELKAWSKKLAKDGLGASYKKQLKALEKTTTLVVLDMPCAGAFNTVILGVVKDKDGAAKISTVLSSHGDCGE